MIDGNASNAPATLYHYTSTIGLIGIIKHKQLWATDAEFLNDAEELRFGRAELVQYLSIKATHSLPSGNRLSDSFTSICEVLNDPIATEAWAPPPAPHRVYVACFCQRGDLLSQWRAYASGGFCVEFGAGALLGNLSGNTPHWTLRKIRYGASGIQPMIEGIESTLASVWRSTAHPGVWGAEIGYPLSLAGLATVKHEAFEEEQEWRLITSGRLPGAEIGFRDGRLGPTPYASIPLAEGVIQSVTVGPGANQRLRAIAARQLLDAASLDSVAVVMDGAPLR